MHSALNAMISAVVLADRNRSIRPHSKSFGSHGWRLAISSSLLRTVHSARCTTRCTGDAESADEPTTDPLAVFVASPTAEQRQRLANLLTGEYEGRDDA
jgi:hypothetical protein